MKEIPKAPYQGTCNISCHSKYGDSNFLRHLFHQLSQCKRPVEFVKMRLDDDKMLRLCESCLHGKIKFTFGPNGKGTSPTEAFRYASVVSNSLYR